MRLPSALLARLHRQSMAERWGVSTEALGAAVEASASRAFAGRSPSSDELTRYVERLHLDDLVLASACAAGHEAAWNHFVAEYRPVLYRAAEAIDRSSGAHELADSIYGELFGLRDAGGERRSLFRYFHGRSSLGTWLRAILAQRHVDRVRAGRRLDAIPEPDGAGAGVPPALQTIDPPPVASAHAAAVRESLRIAIDALPDRDRLRLGLYYVQNAKLAAIGAILHEHEATVSRHLARTRGAIRDTIGRLLRDEHGLSAAAIDEAIRAIVDDPGPLDVAAIIGIVPAGKNADGPRSTK